MRRRRFAQSVVVTFSLAELACTSSGPGHTVNPPPPSDDGAADGAAADGAADEGGFIGPADDGGPAIADDGGADGADDGETPTTIGEPKTTVHKRPDGTCWETITVDCPPNVACNPPPPKQVDCEPEALPEPKVVENVHTRDDGTCWESANVECKPGRTCNPPPPMQVKCPEPATP